MIAGMESKKILIILSHAFAIWALCGAIMGPGLAVTSERNALIAHAIGAPLITVVVSFFYFKKFNYTSPLETAAIFLSFTIFMDIFVVSILIQRSFQMFSSFLGTWIPLTLIFLSTFLTGTLVKRGL